MVNMSGGSATGSDDNIDGIFARASRSATATLTAMASTKSAGAPSSRRQGR
jgi:hypothetical protein